MSKGFGVAAITHKNSATHQKAMSVSGADLKNIITKLKTLNSSSLQNFEEFEVQTSQNRPNCNQTEISKTSDGSC